MKVAGKTNKLRPPSATGSAQLTLSLQQLERGLSPSSRFPLSLGQQLPLLLQPLLPLLLLLLLFFFALLLQSLLEIRARG